MTRLTSLVGVCLVALVLATPAAAQVGQGILDLNAVPEATLATLPGMNAGIAKAFVAARPFPTIVEANAFLLGQKLTQEQLTPLYEKAFVHVNLNTATRDEIMLIPGAGARMAREFAEYRPWKTWAQFDKEISKYVGAGETARLAQYCFIPVNLNSASDADLQRIPGVGTRMLHEFKEYRPWKSKEQFEKEITKYVGAAETARLWRYVVIQ